MKKTTITWLIVTLLIFILSIIGIYYSMTRECNINLGLPIEIPKELINMLCLMNSPLLIIISTLSFTGLSVSGYYLIKKIVMIK